MKAGGFGMRRETRGAETGEASRGRRHGPIRDLGGASSAHPCSRGCLSRHRLDGIIRRLAVIPYADTDHVSGDANVVYEGPQSR